MSLITQCPACATMFKVVPDQLRISDGWVRCGQCDEVFDANAHLQTVLDTAPVVVPGESSEVLDWGGMLETDVQSPEPTISLEFPATPPLAPSLAPAPADPAEAADLVRTAGVSASDLLGEKEPDDLVTVEPNVDAAIDPLDAVPGDDVAMPVASEIQDDLQREPVDTPAPALVPEEVDIPQFLKAHPASEIKASRTTRAVWISSSILLVCVLVAQVVVHERNRIVATVPSVATWVRPICDVLGCGIAPLQQIESIVIDHSSFSKVQSDGYVLGFAVKSTALTEVAIPSLELTLTDMRDQVIVRRVFSPRELGYPSQVLGPRGEWSSSVAVDVKLTGGSERISGYRLLAFYP